MSRIYGYIYLYECTANGKRYIGQSIRELGNRRRQHEYKARNKPILLIDQAIRKHGVDCFKFSVVFVVFITGENDQQILDEAECRLIELFETDAYKGKGYNIKEGGAKGAHSEKTKEKIRNANADSLRAIALANTGAIRPIEWNDKIRQAKLGKPTVLRGKPKSPEHAAKLRVICLRNADNCKGKVPPNKGKISPLRGKPTHPNSRAALEQIWESRRGKVGFATGLVWITNGTENKRVLPDTILLEGWKIGRVIKKKQSGRVYL